jgi:hypothetical protein
MRLDHYRLMTLEKLKVCVTKDLSFKRYKINEYPSTGQISLFVPIKNKTLRTLIQDYLKIMMPVSVFLIVLSLKWHQGWFCKYKLIKSPQK